MRPILIKFRKLLIFIILKNNANFSYIIAVHVAKESDDTPTRNLFGSCLEKAGRGFLLGPTLKMDAF